MCNMVVSEGFFPLFNTFALFCYIRIAGSLHLDKRLSSDEEWPFYLEFQVYNSQLKHVNNHYRRCTILNKSLNILQSNKHKF